MAIFLVKIDKAKTTIILNFITKQILKFIKMAIKKEDNYTIAKLGWLNKKTLKNSL